MNEFIDKKVPDVKIMVGTHAISVPVDHWIRNVLDEEFGNNGRKKRKKQ